MSLKFTTEFILLYNLFTPHVRPFQLIFTHKYQRFLESKALALGFLDSIASLSAKSKVLDSKSKSKTLDSKSKFKALDSKSNIFLFFYFPHVLNNTSVFMVKF